MSKTNEKKINWKKIAIIGGVFGLGALVGVVADRKILEYLIKTENVFVSVSKSTVRTICGKPSIELIVECDKAGLTVPTVVSRDFVEDMLDMIDGKPFDLEKFFA